MKKYYWHMLPILQFIAKPSFVLFSSTFRICSIAKKTNSAQLPNVEENSVVNQCISQNLGFLAIVLAVHYLEKKTLYAVLAPNTAQDDLKDNWKVAGVRLGPRLKSGELIYICVPLDKDTAHLPLEDFVLW
jgi:hypothetical protein